MNGFRKIKIAILSILFPAMILLASNAVFNLHVHRQADGTLITHAHPYQKSGTPDGKTHHHSSQEYFSWHQITSFLFSIATIFYLTALIGKAFKLNSVYHVIVKEGLLATLLPKRAPPVLL